MRGSSSSPAAAGGPRPPSRAEIPVDCESHAIRFVEGVGCARFQVAGKARAASCRLGRRDRTALADSGPVRRPLPGENREGRRGRRLARETAGLSAGVRAGGGASAVVSARTEDQPEPGTRVRRAAGVAAVRPGPAGPRARSCRRAPRRAATGDPQSGTGPSRPPAPLTATATCPGIVSWSWAPDGSRARQGGPVTLPPGTETAGTGRHRPDAR
jgi:hypothetical protein